MVREFTQHLEYCATHWNVYDRHVAFLMHHNQVGADAHHRDGMCHTWMSAGHWCQAQVPGDTLLCQRHIETNRRKMERAEEERMLNIRSRDRMRWLAEQNPRLTWRRAIEMMFQLDGDLGQARLYRLAIHYFAVQTHLGLEPGFDQNWQMQAHFQWASHGGIGPPPNLLNPAVVPPPPRADRNRLDVIARDPQSVHTRAVSDQTNIGLEKLLKKAEGSVELRAPEWFAARWLVRGYGDWKTVTRVVNDMKHWYDMPFCKVDGDWLFKRALDGLYLSIRKCKIERQRELYQRVFEESLESVGMCCEGHISRLCNVMVGFDDAFVSPVPFGEILQSKMAAISNMEIDTDEKIKQATAFFNEFSVPETERSAWLEAF